MKRFLLIAAGTVGGLGAVLSVTPPQLGATDLGLGLDMGTLTTSETPAQTPAVVDSNPVTGVPTKSATKPSTSKPTTSTQTQTSAPAPTAARSPTTHQQGDHIDDHESVTSTSRFKLGDS